MHIFVTVGTTEFNELIETASNPHICQLLAQNGGYRSMTLQIGKGSFVPPSQEDLADNNNAHKYLQMDHFRMKQTISDDMKRADLVISHAGAGSLFEALKLKKKVIAVVNESLMDNHQRELAEVLRREGNLVMTTYSELEKLFSNQEFFSNTLPNLIPLEEPATPKFAQIVNTEMGLLYSLHVV